MNHITVKETATPYGYRENYWVIDGISLPEYLDAWANRSVDDDLKSMQPFLGLCPAWSKRLDQKGDIRFVWKLIEMDSVVLPLLLCSDDLDFSCIVIAAEVNKTEDYVYWNKIGYVSHANEDFEEEKQSGILNLCAYSDEDWEKYGDNVALEEVNSYAWKEWIGKNWEEELYRRRMNYTLPYYQTEGNICWIKEVGWVFERAEYDQMVKAFWRMEVQKQLENLSEDEVIDKEKCAYMIADLTLDGKKMLKQHQKDYGEIQLHLLAGDLISEPLIELLKHHEDRVDDIKMYCKAIEVMWKNGDDYVVNVVDVTILERLSDEECVWQRFGTLISDKFKEYINKEVLVNNLMMGGVKELRQFKNLKT